MSQQLIHHLCQYFYFRLNDFMIEGMFMVISNLSFKNNAIYERVNGMSWTNNGGGGN